MIIEELFEYPELAELEKCDALAFWDNIDDIQHYITHTLHTNYTNYWIIGSERR